MSRGTVWRVARRWGWPWPDEVPRPTETPGPLPDWYPRDAVLDRFAEAAKGLPDGVEAAWGRGAAPSDLMQRGIEMEIRLRGTGGANGDIAVADPDRLPDRQRALFEVAMGVLGQAWLDAWDIVDDAEIVASGGAV